MIDQPNPAPATGPNDAPQPDLKPGTYNIDLDDDVQSVSVNTIVVPKPPPRLSVQIVVVPKPRPR